MIRCLNIRDAYLEGYKHLNVTSRAKDWGKELSPFFLGPIETRIGYAKNVENAWQFSKVYQDLAHWDSYKNVPTLTWYDFKYTGYQDGFAHRYPAGKGKKPIGCWYPDPEGTYKLLSYVEARKEIYIPLYLQALRNSNVYFKLIEFITGNENIAFIDFDVYDHVQAGDSLESIINDPHKKYGHGFVLAAEAQRILSYLNS